MPAQIFINYRRADAAAEAAQIAQGLRARFGPSSVFVDGSSIEVGENWPVALQEAVAGSNVMLVLIGPDWLRAGMNEWGQRRIDANDDWVRLELELALTSDKVLMPILLRGARMPPASVLPATLCTLPSCQAIPLAPSEVDDVGKVAKLVQGIARHVRVAGLSCIAPGKYELAPVEIVHAALASELERWTLTPDCGDATSDPQAECLKRDFAFSSFSDAIRFMSNVAPQFELSYHHPLWENVFRRLTVRLSTWDLSWRVSQLDLAHARFLEREYVRHQAVQKSLAHPDDA